MIYIIYSIVTLYIYIYIIIYHDPKSAIFKGETNGEMGTFNFLKSHN